MTDLVARIVVGKEERHLVLVEEVCSDTGEHFATTDCLLGSNIRDIEFWSWLVGLNE